jgi:hypothetical protein
MASGPLVVKLEIKADGSAAIVGLNKVQGALDTTGKKGKEASVGVNSLSSSLKSLAMTAGAALSVGALAASFTSANRQAGLLRASLETVTGSVAKATTAWEVLQGFAAQTPYSLEQTVQGFIKLKSMGLDPSMAALTSYGNTAGAMGKSLNQMIEAVADAATGEFERLKEFGIKAKIEKDQVVMTFQGATTSIANNAQQLGKMLEQGQVVATDLLPKLSQKLLKLYDDGTRIGGMGAEWERVKNAANAFFVELDKGTGITGAIATLLSDVASAFKGMTTSLVESAGSTGIFATAMASLGETIKTTRAELISGEWSESTTLIMAVAGAAAGMAAIMVTLSGAIGVVNVAMGILTGILALNPFTAIILAIGATAGALYALSEQTVTVGDTTATVGSMVQAAWEITATNSVAAWEVFTGWILRIGGVQ